jgi:CheY-like chemotaxis protein
MSATTKAAVLVVEDHPETRELMLDVLQGEGYSVTAAGTAADALAQVRHSCPRLVLLDLGLPDGDGLEVARHIRGLPDGRRVAIVALSGHFGLADTPTVLQSGADVFLPKPVDLLELEQVMAKLLTSH